mmetsp:Transcript_33706/g.100370  ORF Transcript_33706/g.100370 Transcript_33706/m.100370 type:complete len:222 (-) Transcript_33706:948-1613(-)
MSWCASAHICLMCASGFHCCNRKQMARQSRLRAAGQLPSCCSSHPPLFLSQPHGACHPAVRPASASAASAASTRPTRCATSTSTSSGATSAKRTKPVPPGPNALPGATATPSRVSSSTAKRTSSTEPRSATGRRPHRYIQLRGIEMSQPACCSSAADRALARACHVAASLRSRCLGSARHAIPARWIPAHWLKSMTALTPASAAMASALPSMKPRRSPGTW